MLFDNLEGKMKKTDVEGCISDMFVGQQETHIECLNVDYHATRVEPFYDISVNVKVCQPCACRC